MSTVVAQRRGEGTPLVLVPGLAGGVETWAAVIDALAQRHRVHALTFPGFAGVPLPAADSASLGAMVDVLVEYLAAIDAPVVVAHSLGVCVALEAAVRSPGRLVGLVLVDGVPSAAALAGWAPDRARVWAADYRARLRGGSVEQVAAYLEGEFRAMVGDGPTSDAIVAAATRSDPRAVGERMAELMTTDLRAELSAVDCETLVVLPRPSRAGPESAYRAQFAALPRHRFAFVDGVGHFVMNDAPERFAEIVNDFGDRIAAAARAGAR